jgi:hypothetical protein
MVKKLHAAVVKDKLKQYRRKPMKSLIRKEQVSAKKVAQCCAKISKNVAGCHD